MGHEAGQQLERVAAQIWDDLHVPPDERKRAAVLVRAVITQGVEIDARSRDVTTNWRLERLGAIERSRAPPRRARSSGSTTRRRASSSRKR